LAQTIRHHAGLNSAGATRKIPGNVRPPHRAPQPV